MFRVTLVSLNIFRNQISTPVPCKFLFRCFRDPIVNTLTDILCESGNLSVPYIVTYSPDGLNDTILKRDMLRIRQNIPFQIPGLRLAEPIAADDIAYYLYTRQHKNLTIGRDFRIINRKYPFKILIHGWTEHNYVEWYQHIISAYIKKGLYNIIAVDWSSKGDADYVTASMAVKSVGDAIGNFLVDLHEKTGVPYKNIHLLSHSLGCHVAGYTGKRVYELTKQKIARITAMDPAAPIFDLMPWDLSSRLSKDDANFVDIVHTDGGMLGFNYAIGTADFFPNGGSALQPGCSLMKLDVKYEDLFCSHASSHQLFIKSINSRRFIAKPCESWEKFASGLCKDNEFVVFGENVPQNVSGKFYLETEGSDIILE